MALNMEDEAKVANVRALLQQELRVSLSDGRVIIGHLVCFDKFKNLVLAECSEFKAVGDAGGSGELQPLRKRLKEVIIPGAKVEKIAARAAD